MAISDIYVVQYLIQETREERSIDWRERELDGYIADTRGLRVELESISTRLGARINLTLSCGVDSVQILEPERRGIFSQRFANDEQRRLAQLLRDLLAAAGRQCEARRNRSPDETDRLREAIFGRLIGVAETEEVERLASR